MVRLSLLSSPLIPFLLCNTRIGYAFRFNPTKKLPLSTASASTMSSNDDQQPEAKRVKKTIPSIKVYYWNFPFWRAEVLRAGLFLQGIPFDNVTDRGMLDELKKAGKVPFGAFPVLEIDNNKILSQTQACATFVGKLGSMYPSNDDTLAQANCDEIINGCTDVTNTISATFRMSDKDEVKEAREKLMDPKGGRLYMHLNGLNSIVCQDGSDYACGQDHGLTVADLAVWKLVNWFSVGKLDHVPRDFVLSSFSNLKKIYENVERNEKIQEYQKKYYPEN